MLDFNQEVKKENYSIPHNSNYENPTRIKVTFSINDEEKVELGVKSKYTTLEYSGENKTNTPTILEGFNKEYFSTKLYFDLLDRINTSLEGESLTKFKNLRESTFNIMNSKHIIMWLHNISIIKKLPVSKEKKTEYNLLMNELQDYIERIYIKFPKVFYYKEEQLLNNYILSDSKFNEFEKNYNNGLINLLKTIEVPVDELKKATLNNNNAVKRNFSDKLQTNINKYINRPFNENYSQEKIELIGDLSNQNLTFFVKSNGKNINFQERSNGLRWYLSLFIALQAEHGNYDTIFFVIDEPAVSLHVDAQIEVEKLFYELPSNVQLLYSTHSPFLVDENKLVNLRAIQKNVDGNSEIINSITSTKIIGSSNKETLSPILKAIGMSGSYALGVDSSKINIITEGITDAIYLKKMSQLLGYDNRFSFIASMGASQILNIALILEAWDLSYICLLDSDKAGFRAKKYLEKFMIDKIAMISEIIERPGSIEDIIHIDDFNNIAMTAQQIKEHKKIAAKLLTQHWTSADKINLNTKENFEKLFNILTGKVSKLEND